MPFLLFVAVCAFGLSPLLTPDFGGFEADQFPIPQNDPPVQPAGYAFSIWGVIYLWLLAGALFQWLRRHNDPIWDPIRGPLALSVAVGAIWLSVAFVSPFWATVLIWVMWGPAVLALLRAPEFDRLWGEGPIGLYAGWLTAASCVALGLMAGGYGLMDPVTAAVAALVLALALALAILTRRPGAYSFGAAFIWALIGVIVANGFNEPLVSGLALVGIAVVSALLARDWREMRA